jgi:hypothetical protein
MRRPGLWLVVISAVLLLAFVYALFFQAGGDRARVAAARRGVLALSDYLEMYKLNNGDYPPSLAALTEQQPCGRGPLTDEAALTDPWGRPYEYDPIGKSDSARAEVWSWGPDPRDPTGIIGNRLGSAPPDGPPPSQP